MELLDGLKTDVADNNSAMNEKRAQEAALTEKVRPCTKGTHTMRAIFVVVVFFLMVCVARRAVPAAGRGA